MAVERHDTHIPTLADMGRCPAESTALAAISRRMRLFRSLSDMGLTRDGHLRHALVLALICIIC